MGEAKNGPDRRLPEKQPLLRDEKGRFSRKKPTRRGNTDDGTRGLKEALLGGAVPMTSV